jgi:predicted 2-oxoglutarate/Fe(II)-dependent dioxygenase YbiX
MATPSMKILSESDNLFTIPSVLTPEECAERIRKTEAIGFTDAPITTGRGFVMRPETRNNTRVMQDDTESAEWLWERIARHVAPTLGPWRAAGLNERLRYYRYEPGQYFKWHGDGAFIRSERVRSLFTVMVYLNDDFEGGSTDFWDGLSITPERGMALIFEHSLIHQGAPVVRGRKYVLRSDVMYYYQGNGSS